MDGPNIPVLGYTPNRAMHDNDSASQAASRVIVGTADLTLDGLPFPWATVGDWTVKFTEDGIANLTVSIAVTLPQDPAA